LLGKGKSESVAKEGALKIKEISYIHSEGYSTSSLKHGPFALLDEKFPVIILAPKNLHYSKAENAYEEIKSRYSPVIFITDNMDEKKENVLYIPENKTFGDLLCVIPLQLLAYKLSVAKGLNPDMPKNLAKVVSVE
jgi:glucosamine--fructose-6-phosphate aminotransferase (isomerizing)